MRRWQHDSPSNAAQLRLASDDAAQLSSLPGSAEQRADEGCRRARDGKLYTRAQFHAHYGFYLGEEHWQKALDELTQRDEPANVGATGAPRLRSAEQPASSLHRAAQLASDVHNAARANHSEFMMFLQSTLYGFYDIWRSMNEPKKVRASWSSQWNNLTRTLEAIARDAASHNCLHESDCSVSRVAQPASNEELTTTSSLLFWKVSTTCNINDELILLLDRLPRSTVHNVAWAEVKRLFESMRCDDAAFNTHCAAEAASELNKGHLHMKNIAAEAQR